ncbi:MAG TPA: septum formation initiator family protein [Bacillota bacterium]|nr:septum formation initiator family protein [Bacillota bacterium]
MKTTINRSEPTGSLLTLPSRLPARDIALVDKHLEEELKEKKKRARARLRKRKLLLTLVVSYGAVVLFSFGQQFFQMQRIESDMDRVQAEIISMQEKNKQLHSEVKRLNSDAYVERIAREKLGLVKQGETVLLPAQVSSSGKVLPNGNNTDTNE